ncbi:MAG: peptidoglycan DD-metalloendopeptidase family protein, partial [Candidatus Wallbacteria bacterium]|nr:peptidoglycan DD-metalloendopeptidase family protein [Candidatus Wallbacteria bacterium]
MKLCLTFLLFLFLLPALATEEISTEATAIINQIIRIRQQESEIIGSLEKIERDLKVFEDKITATRTTIASLEVEIDRLEESIALHRGQMDTHKQSYFKSLKSYYATRNSSYLAFLLSTRNTEEFLRRTKLLQFIALRKSSILNDLTSRLDTIRQSHILLRDRREEISYHREKLIFDQKQLARVKDEKEEILGHIRTKQEELQKKYEEFQKGSTRISQVLEEIKSDSHESSDEIIVAGIRDPVAAGVPEKPAVPKINNPIVSPDGKSKLNLLWPVGDINSVVAFFGKQKNQFQTSYFSTGINIACEAGCSIKASSAGKVMYKGFVEGFGNVLILDHGNGYTT